MSPDRAASTISGVRFGAVDRHVDPRGSFRELWRADDGLPFVQANLSSSASGVLRGLHLHRHQVDYWVVASGRAFLALVDIRSILEGIAGTPGVETRVMEADDWVVIPEGVAHGFLALEPLDLLYLVTNLYDGTDELGFAWDDPVAAVPWPVPAGNGIGRPTVSQRDATNPSLTELVDRLREEATRGIPRSAEWS